MQLVNTTVEDVAIKESLSYDSVLGILERCVEAQVDWSRYTRLDTIGLDEIALRKGRRNFVVIVTARLFWQTGKRKAWLNSCVRSQNG
jgi:hypothetical protein